MQTWRNEESLLHTSGTSSGHSGNFVISFPFPPSALISLFCPLSLHHTDICVPVVEISARLSHSCIRRADTSQLICIYCPCVCMCVFLLRVVKFYLFSSRNSDFILLLQSQWWPKNMDPSLSFNKNVFVQLWDSGETGPVQVRPGPAFSCLAPEDRWARLGFLIQSERPSRQPQTPSPSKFPLKIGHSDLLERELE